MCAYNRRMEELCIRWYVDARSYDTSHVQINRLRADVGLSKLLRQWCEDAIATY